MGLIVEYGWRIQSNSRDKMWLVSVKRFGRSGGVLFGFGRKVDAEIVAKVLPETGIDWNHKSASVINRQIEEYGGKEALMKFACEHLQW